jgi:hypothetical protein
MSKGTRSGYLKAASRFLGLAAGAEEEEVTAASAAAGTTTDARASEDEDGEKDEKKGKKAKKGGKDCPDAEDDSDDEEASAAEDDEDEDEDDEKDEKKKASAQARAAERARWAAVLSSDEAKGRSPLACSLLADTDMPEDKIRSALLASPAHGEPAKGLAARMASVPRVDIGSAPAATGHDPSTPKGRATVMMAAYDKATGGKA